MRKYDKGKHSKKKVVSIQILKSLFLTIILVVLAYCLYHWHLSNRNKSIYDKIEKKVQEETETGKTKNRQKVEMLKKENSDVIGWIQISDTNINYPLLQTQNNDYYLTHNYQKEKSQYGSIFLKAECNLLDNNSNLMIYGHNRQDRQMFYSLLNYCDKSYYEKHKNIQIATLEEENNYSIVTVFKSRVFYEDEKDVFKYYNYTNFRDEKEYQEFINKSKEIQLYDTGVSAEYGQQLITLITCEYSQNNGRLVVIAKKN